MKLKISLLLIFFVTTRITCQSIATLLNSIESYQNNLSAFDDNLSKKAINQAEANLGQAITQLDTISQVGNSLALFDARQTDLSDVGFYPKENLGASDDQAKNYFMQQVAQQKQILQGKSKSLQQAKADLFKQPVNSASITKQAPIPQQLPPKKPTPSIGKATPSVQQSSSSSDSQSPQASDDSDDFSTIKEGTDPQTEINTLQSNLSSIENKIIAADQYKALHHPLIDDIGSFNSAANQNPENNNLGAVTSKQKAINQLRSSFNSSQNDLKAIKTIGKTGFNDVSNQIDVVKKAIDALVNSLIKSPNKSMSDKTKEILGGTLGPIGLTIVGLLFKWASKYKEGRDNGLSKEEARAEANKVVGQDVILKVKKYFGIDVDDPNLITPENLEKAVKNVFKQFLSEQQKQLVDALGKQSFSEFNKMSLDELNKFTDVKITDQQFAQIKQEVMQQKVKDFAAQAERTYNTLQELGGSIPKNTLNKALDISQKASKINVNDVINDPQLFESLQTKFENLVTDVSKLPDLPEFDTKLPDFKPIEIDPVQPYEPGVLPGEAAMGAI